MIQNQRKVKEEKKNGIPMKTKKKRKMKIRRKIEEN